MYVLKAETATLLIQTVSTNVIGKYWIGLKQTNKQTCVECMLTLIDKVCHMLYLHKFWGDALLVQQQQSLQKLFPT